MNQDSSDDFIKRRILVSILNWNGTEDTLKCLSAIDTSDTDVLDFFVLDNGSKDDPTAQIAAEFPNVEIARFPINQGFTGGHNFVISRALERGYNSVLILNNDCRIGISDIRELQSILDARPNVAAVSPLIYSDTPERRPQAVAGWLDWAQHQSIHPSKPGMAPPTNCPPHVLGTALLLRCAALKKIGLLDDRYFAYYEDNDLSARIFHEGYEAVYCETAVAFHRSREINECSSLSLYLSARNIWLFWKSRTPKEHRRGLRRHLLHQSLYELSQLKKRNAEQEKLHAIVDGFWDGIWGRFGPPPKERHSPWLLRKIATTAPYFFSQMLKAPISTVVRKLIPRLAP